MNLKEQFNFNDRIGRVHYLVFSIVSMLIGSIAFLIKKADIIGPSNAILLLIVAIASFIVS